jgi:hypothetical protein
LDDTYQIYVNRVARLTLTATYHSQLLNIQPSPKFEQGQPVPFPGCSVITPPGEEDGDNFPLYEQLTEIQQKLKAVFGSCLGSLPPQSFHLTLADLIWDTKYQEAIAENPQFNQQLKSSIQKSFNNYKSPGNNTGIIEWQILGVLVLPRALAIALVPKTEIDYPPIWELRRSLYQNPSLMALGIEQQYNFTAHITLGYFDEIPANFNIETTTEQLNQINDHWLESEPQIFKIRQAELRHFSDMTQFQRDADDPILHFT